MASTTWNPQLYSKFADERGRPYVDLVSAIETRDPTYVVDLGCGPGSMTALLSDRWPAALVHGWDSSEEMIERAGRLHRPGRLTFSMGRIEQWAPGDESVDVIVANASLQWVPDHVARLPVWIRALRPGGSLAFQVTPSGSPASVVFRTIAYSPRWANRLAGVAAGDGPWGDRGPVLEPDGYLTRLVGLGVDLTVWETTYLHVLPGDDPVMEWFAATALRPYLEALGDDADAVAEYRAEVAAALRAAYPRRPFGTILPFRRVFVVARRYGQLAAP